MRKNALSSNIAPGGRGFLFPFARYNFPASRTALPPVAAGLFFNAMQRRNADDPTI